MAAACSSLGKHGCWTVLLFRDHKLRYYVVAMFARQAIDHNRAMWRIYGLTIKRLGAAELAANLKDV